MNLLKSSKNSTLPMLILGTGMLLVSMAALNGGVAPSTGAFTTFVTYIKSLLTSDFVYFLAFIALIAGLWQAKRGQYVLIEAVAIVLVLAFAGPSIITTAATATLPVVSSLSSTL